MFSQSFSCSSSYSSSCSFSLPDSLSFLPHVLILTQFWALLLIGAKLTFIMFCWLTPAIISLNSPYSSFMASLLAWPDFGLPDIGLPDMGLSMAISSVLSMLHGAAVAVAASTQRDCFILAMCSV